MAHELATMTDGRTAMAFVGEKPWHGLGQNLTKDSPIEIWTKEAGFDYEIVPVKAMFQPVGGKEIKGFDGKKILYRNDTKQALSVVSDSYKIVQPKEVMEFFRDLVATGDFHLETAGILFGGTRYWAMADANYEGDVIKNDRIKGRLLLTTSCDGTLATTAKFISERVVCNNTLRIALGEKDESKKQVRVTHGSAFDPTKIKEALGLLDAGWDVFMKNIKRMAKTKISDAGAKDFIASIMLNTTQLEAFREEEEIHKRVQDKLDTIFAMYKGAGMGADMVTGTVWGALNAVTEYADHRIGQKDDNKLWNSWFGYSESLKNNAFDKAIELI